VSAAVKIRCAKARRALERVVGKGLVHVHRERHTDHGVICSLRLGTPPSLEQQSQTSRMLEDVGIIDAQLMRTMTDADGRGWWLFHGSLP
jgi:hypothetical protein